MARRIRATSKLAGMCAALALSTALSGEAIASTYGVHECSGSEAPDASFEGGAANYVTTNSCSTGGSLKVRSGGAVGPGINKSWVLTAPSGTQINRATASMGLRGVTDPNGNFAYLFVRPIGGTEQVRASVRQGQNFDSYDTVRDGVGATDRIGVAMACTHSAAEGSCSLRDGMFAELSDIGLEMEDTVAPAAPVVSGPALSGWIHGDAQIDYAATDVGAGVFVGATAVNGQVIDFDGFCSPPVDSSGAVTRMKPCPSSASGASSLKLTDAPFEEGRNQIRICVAEYGQNPQVTCRDEMAYVDNGAPFVAFTDHQDPQDPDKLIAPVGDATSGVVGGKISYRREGGDWKALETRFEVDHLEARVDSTDLEPSIRYDFQAIAVDRAGNETTTTLRADGSQMSVVGPFRTRSDVVQLRVNGASRANVVYGKAGVVTGRVLSLDGTPVGGAAVVVRQEFASGARQKARTLQAVAKPDGRFRAPLPLGPSRSITARYGGDRRYLGSRSSKVKLAVRAKVGLAVRPRVRAGRAVTFTGELKARGTRNSKAGKRLEVQVKVGPKWKTVGRSTTTDRDGSYRLRYRFTASYEQPIRFSFRTVVPRERSWPYLTATSNERQVLVYP